MALAARLVRGLGSDNVDFRLRQTDFRGNGHAQGVPWLGHADRRRCNKLDRVLVVGSFLRKDHPLVAQRLRQAAKKGTQVSMLHSVDDDWLVRVAHKAIVAPSQLPAALAGIVVAARRRGGNAVPGRAGRRRRPTDARARRSPPASRPARRPRSCSAITRCSTRTPRSSTRWRRCSRETTGATLGFLTEAANTVGAHLAGALPQIGRHERAGDARRSAQGVPAAARRARVRFRQARRRRAARSSRRTSSS